MNRLAALGCFLTLGVALADTVRYTYDDAGRLTKVDYGNGQTITYTYDSAGNLLSRTVTSAGAGAGSAAKTKHAGERRSAPARREENHGR